MASTTLRDYLRHTEDAISAGRLNDAMANCQRVLSHFPESLEAQRLLGEVYLALGHLEDARQTFDWILTNDPENVVVYCDRALICERLSDVETALDCYQQAYELSRGDSQVRQEFNKLSAKAGQPGFMFSRAGLARLYMRGDLLPQAIQEWEIILSSNPERLDARVGLLEACWRDGLYEQVEEQATSILNDVPGCLKALLLLAHVTSMKDLQQAQDLLQRAEIMDPELLMAQELFSDLIASQPNDPFLQLVNRDAVLIPGQTAPHAAALTTPAFAESSAAHTNGSQTASTFSDSLVNWNNLDALMHTQQQSEAEPDIPTFAWSSNSAIDINPWSTVEQPGNRHSERTEQSEPPTAKAVEIEQQVSHPAIPAIPGTPVPAESTQREEESVETQTWNQAEELGEPEAETYQAWSSINSMNSETASNTWGAEAREEGAQAAPPAWLDMLTKSDRRGASQPRANDTAASPSTPESASPILPQEASPASSYLPVKESHQKPLVPQDDEEELSFGPEWLKSLGATVFEEQTSAKQGEPVASPAANEPEAVIASPETTLPPVSDFWQQPGAESWLSQLGQPFQTDTQQQAPIDPRAEPSVPTASVDNWQVPIDPWAQAAPVQPTAGNEIEQTQQAALEALETMEREMYAQGFVPLEPGSLAAIAEDETLSSALSQPGTFQLEPDELVQPAPLPEPSQPVKSVQTRPLPPVSEPSVMPAQTVEQATRSEAPTSEPVEEPLWLPEPEPAYNAPALPVSSPVAEPAPVPVARIESQLQLQAEQFKGIVEEPATVTRYTPPRPPSVPSPVKSAATHTQPGGETSLDSELEMTMRRPAVRLQAMTQRSTLFQSYATPTSKGRTNGTGKNGNSNLSYKERLLKGYHHQLAGDYDEAMQEYRVIIRNAPELLGEVISNMRALLKLAPRYSPGYRVLGDAYMRQGEYLQAMEAYNKALTMPKKGQGSR